VSEGSKTLFPDSDQVYQSDYSPVTIINEMNTFTAPLQLLKKDALMVRTPFTHTRTPAYIHTHAHTSHARCGLRAGVWMVGGCGWWAGVWMVASSVREHIRSACLLGR